MYWNSVLLLHIPYYRYTAVQYTSIGIQYQSESGPGYKLPADDHSAKSVSRLLLTSPFCPVAIGAKFSRRQTIQRKHDANGPQIAKIPPIQIWGINYPNTPVHGTIIENHAMNEDRPAGLRGMLVSEPTEIRVFGPSVFAHEFH